MYEAFAKLLNMSLSASVLVFALLLYRVLFRRSSKRMICMLWLLVAVRLVCPVAFGDPDGNVLGGRKYRNNGPWKIITLN